MDSEPTRAVRQRFVVMHDYGMGGVWLYIIAESREQVTENYPEWEIVDQPPPWWTDQLEQDVKTYSLEALEDELPVMREFRAWNETGNERS